MNEKSQEFSTKYLLIRDEIDVLTNRLNHLHTKQMQCKEGCSSCCESISVFEVEFDTIQQQIKASNIKLPKPLFLQRFTKRCRFLVNNRCSIYEYRPIICRTQGLPILYRSMNSNDYELSVCQLNFKGVKLNSFNDENALMMSPLNTKLLLLNHAYMKETAPSQKDLNKRRNLYELES